jgi:hypothetical protein
MNMKVRGLGDINKIFKKLPERLERNVVRTALRAGGRVVRREARSNLAASPSIDTGLLSQSLGLAERKKSASGGIVISLGARKGFKKSVVRKGRLKAILASAAAGVARETAHLAAGRKNFVTGKKR